jgi:glycolate oxidase FAD binding subunit
VLEAGVPLAEAQAAFGAEGQMLALDPPLGEGDAATLGGVIAANDSGPLRHRYGGVRDLVVGMTVVLSDGTIAKSGGKVIKNVAGYDVSRVISGSLGTLGIVVEATLKVLPKAEAQATLRFDLKPADALAALHAWGGEPLPLDASAWWNGNLVLRLSGAAAAVDAAARRLGGEPIPVAAAMPFWEGLRDHRDEFFVAAREAIEHQDGALWRLSLPPTAPLLGLAGDELIEWHGGQRWLVTSLPATLVRDAAARVGGHATLFRGGDKSAGVFTKLSPPLHAIHERLKRAFDPNGILNPGRLYPDL